MKLTLENLQAKGVCAAGLEWITPILGEPDVWDRLVSEHPAWAQWAVENGFTHEISEPVWERMGCVMVGGSLRFAQTAGYGSTQTAGHYSTQAAGDYSTQAAGYGSTQAAGYGSTQAAGDYSTQAAGYYSTQTAGYGSTQTAGYGSTQTAGYGSTQTAGHYSTQTAGCYSTQTAGVGSRHKAGEGSVFVCRYFHGGWQVAVTINPDPNFYWTYDTEKGDWVHAKDQTEPEVNS